MIRVLLILLASSLVAVGAMLPSDRTISWSPGVEGGIPNRTNMHCNVKVSIPGTTNLAVGDGVTDDTAAIQSAINNSTNGTYIYFPAGRYRLSALTMGGREITFRGDGTNSVWVGGGGHQITRSTSSYSFTNITSGLSKGSSNITVAGIGPLSVGDIVVIDETNNPAFVTATGGEGYYTAAGRTGTQPYVGSERARPQLAKITGIAGSVLTIEPPLYEDLQSSLDPEIFWWNTISSPRVARKVGFENLVFDTTGYTPAQFTLNFLFADECWVKNCIFIAPDRAAVRFYYTRRCEMRGSTVKWARDVGATSYGVELESSTATLIEDNIFRQIVASIVFGSANAGCVVSANYFNDTKGTEWLYSSIYGHAVHNQYHLLENNISWPGFYFDFIHGSGGKWTMLRNWVKGWTSTNTSNLTPLTIEAWNKTNNIIGNVLGHTNYHESYELSTNFLSATKPIFKLGFPDTGTQTNGYDLETLESTWRHGNWDAVTEAQSWHPSLAETNIPNSLIYSERPSWWTNSITWPAVNPADPHTMANNPARQRYLDGIEIADGGGTGGGSTNTTGRMNATLLRVGNIILR